MRSVNHPYREPMIQGDMPQPRQSIRIGIDLGGTKTEVIALSNDGDELFRKRTPTPGNDYDAIIAVIASLVREAEQAAGCEGRVGIGMPGSLSKTTGLIKNANTTCLIDRPFDRDVASAINRPTRIQNDANCFALSEAIDGAGKDSKVVFGVIVGTGTGGAIVIDRQLVDGPNGITGEWGHNPLPWPTDDERPGPSCYCGKVGCIETFLSGPGLARDHAGVDVEAWTGQRVAQAADAGDVKAQQSMRRYANRMARSLATVINLLDPDVIVLGGGLSNATSLYAEVRASWGQFVFSDGVRTRLLPAVHGDSGGVRGAAWLWHNE